MSRRRLLRFVPPGATITVSTSAGIAVAGGVTGLLTARLLSTSDRGVLAVCFVWIGLLAQLVDCGMPQAIAFFSARNHASAPRVFGRALTIALPQSGVAVVLALVLRGHLIATPSVRGLVLMAVVAVPAVLVQGFVVGVLRGMERYNAMNVVRAIPAALWTTAVVVSYIAHLSSPEWLILVYVVGLWVSSTLGLLIVLHYLDGVALGIRELGPLVRYGLVVWVSGIGHQANARIDQFMLGALATTAVLGVYAVAVGLASTLGIVSMAVGMVTLPQVAAASARTRTAVIRRNVSVTLGVIGAMALVGFVLAPAIVSTLLGPRYAAAVPLLRVLLFAQVALGGNQVLEEVFRGVGRPGVPAVVEGLGTAVTIGLLAYTLPRYGAPAAAWTSLVVYWLVFVSLGVLVRPTVRRVARQSPDFPSSEVEAVGVETF